MLAGGQEFLAHLPVELIRGDDENGIDGGIIHDGTVVGEALFFGNAEFIAHGSQGGLVHIADGADLGTVGHNAPQVGFTHPQTDDGNNEFLIHNSTLLWCSFLYHSTVFLSW